jgi:hypothetical protein
MVLRAMVLTAGVKLNGQQHSAKLRDVPQARKFIFWVGEWNLT